MKKKIKIRNPKTPWRWDNKNFLFGNKKETKEKYADFIMDSVKER